MDRQASRKPESSFGNDDLCCLHYCLLAPCYGQRIPFKRDENIWVYLAKTVLNISDFCLAGGTFFEQAFASCVIGVCTPLESLRNYTVFEHIEKKMTYSDIYNWAPVVTIKDKETFSLKVGIVAPARGCVTFANCTKNRLVLSADVKMNHTTTTDVSHAYAHVKRPTGWFLTCGMTVYSYVPANASGGPCFLGRLTAFMPPKPHSTQIQRDLSLTPLYQ